MSDQGDMFRDAGIELAADADPDWTTRAYIALLKLAREKEFIHIDDFLTVFPERPKHFNANGAIWIKARRLGVLVPTGQARKCRSDSGKHSHVYPVYRSTLYGKPDYLSAPAPEPAPPELPPTNAYYDARGRLIHDKCAIEGCTRSPGYAIGAFLNKGQLGMWYCAEHWRGTLPPERPND